MKINILIPEAYGLFELSVDRRGPFMLETPRSGCFKPPVSV